MDSADMMKVTMESFPMIRPIVLVIKQFLLDKGLLTAYTGGLSSHCLFLMVTRYLQEQNLGCWADVGSLLMGCLDFYGNVFDPRMVGMTVSNAGQYFRRPHYQQRPSYQQDSFNNELSRRHSFQDHDVVAMSNSPSTFGFDPLYVEDPISLGNNVGRNSFRINQVQRAFSDAHRALVASLEWDMNGSDLHDDGINFPLLKSLLPNSDNAY
jgi:DNA polymerase sigma